MTICQAKQYSDMMLCEHCNLRWDTNDPVPPACLLEKHGARVRLRILETGLRLWRVDPQLVTARRIAHELGMTHSAILYHFKSSVRMRDAIAYHAVKQGESKVIAHLIAGNHSAVNAMSDTDRQEHMRLAR